MVARTLHFGTFLIIMMKMTLRQWQTTYKNPKSLIVSASPKDGSDSWQDFPIGMYYLYTAQPDKLRIQIGQHSETLLCAIRTSPNNDTRTQIRIRILNTLLTNSFVNLCMNGSDYFSSLPNYKFVISPEGCGVDCHRHYEALLAGCIPIVQRNLLVEEKYRGCPVLFTDDYSEITEEYLQAKYAEMIDTVYDFSRLFLEYYSEDQIRTMKDNCDYWVEKFTGKRWFLPPRTRIGFNVANRAFQF